MEKMLALRTRGENEACANRLRRAGLVLAAGLLALAPFGMAHGSDCAQPRDRIEQLICSDRGLQHARHDAELRIDALAGWSIAPQGWRHTQSLWERETRDRCEDAECLRAVYAQRNALLQVLHETPTPVMPGRWTPLMPPFVIKQVDDTVVVRLPPLTLTELAQVRVEWQVPAEDRARWSVPGPNGRLLCVPPDAREGYAPSFSYRESTHGHQWPRLRRDGEGLAFELFSFVAGRDVPLHEPVRCSILIGETLVDQPSVLSVWHGPVAEQNR